MTKILIAIAVVAALAVFATLWQGDRDRQFMKTAVRTTAKIIAKEERVADPKTKRKELWVTYGFSVGNTDYTSQEHIEYPDIWQGLRTSYPVDIYYNKAQPGECHLASVIERRLKIVSKLKK